MSGPIGTVLLVAALAGVIGWIVGGLGPRVARWELRLLAPKLPELYPGRPDEALGQPMPAAELALLGALPRLSVRVLATPEGDAELADAAHALTRLAMRELALCPSLASCAVRDTPDEPCPEPADALPMGTPNAHVLGGTLARADSALCATLRLMSGDGRLRERTVRCDDGKALVRELCLSCVEGLGGPSTAHTLRFAMPATLPALARIGAELRQREARDRHEHDDAILDLLDALPDAGVAALDLSHHQLERRLAALAAEPDDAELAATMYAALRAEGIEGRPAWQFLRRALELAPSSGLAHLEWAHAAPAPAQMLGHARLARWLAPWSSFATSSYLAWRARYAPDRAEALTIATAAIAAWPPDPQPYGHLLRAQAQSGDGARALETAHVLMGLLRPLQLRTRACFEHTPERRGALAAGWNPADELERTIAELEKRVPEVAAPQA